MRIFHDLSDRDIERMLSGVAPTGRPELDSLAAHLEEARRSLAKVPAASVQQRHIAAIVHESLSLTEKGELASSSASKAIGSAPQASGLPKKRRVMDRTRSLALKLGVGVIAASLSMVGLAYAGVTLPVPATTAFDKMGLSLPNQAQGSDAATEASQPSALPTAAAHGQAVSALAKSGSGGCSFGQSVAALASSKRQDGDVASNRQDVSQPVNPCAATSSPAGSASDGSHSQAPGYGRDNHPGANGTSSNPTGNGQGNHPSDSTSGQSSNPTGNGQSNHPSDSTSGQSSDPTGYGQDSHPGF